MMSASMTAEEQRPGGTLRTQTQSASRCPQCQQLLERRQLHGAGTFRSSSSTHAWAVMPRAWAP